MKAYFQNLDIQCWEHAGLRLGTLKPEICLQAAPEAIDVLLLAIDELEKEGPPAKRTLTFRPNQRSKQCSTLRILLSDSDDNLRQMSIGRQDSVATFEFTPAALQALRDAVVCWRNGGADFSLFPIWTKRKKKEQGPRTWRLGSCGFGRLAWTRNDNVQSRRRWTGGVSGSGNAQAIS